MEENDLKDAPPAAVWYQGTRQLNTLEKQLSQLILKEKTM